MHLGPTSVFKMVSGFTVLWLVMAAFSWGRVVAAYADEERLGWYLPINTHNRQSLKDVRITNIGAFGLLRRARPGIPAHLHTGVDLKRPHPYYANEPVFPAAKGVVVSLRQDGPYAQIIVRHDMSVSNTLWTVYEHVADIRVRLFEEVDHNRPMARFMNQDELNRYGRHFDHVHFEIMKIEPPEIKPDKERPFRRYGTYCLTCYTPKDLDTKYHHPLTFLKSEWNPGWVR